MKPSTMAHDPAATDASPRLGWRVSLNRFIWRAHIFTAGSLVVWVERVCPNRGYGQRIFSASARLTNRLVGVRVDVIGLDKLDPEQAYVFTPDHRSHVDITALMAALPSGTLRGQARAVRRAGARNGDAGAGHDPDRPR